jgi:hypothetical protein
MMRALIVCVSAAFLVAACDGATPASDAPAATDARPTTASTDSTTPLAEPDFVEGTINAVAFEGDYACDPGFAPQITLGDDGTTRAFRAYLHERLFTSGTWSWDGTTLRIESTAGSFAFTEVALGDGTMVLGTGDERWECRNVPSTAP